MEKLLDVQKCRIWEEEIYWKHFNSMNFCVILPDDFHNCLVLPQKFAENMIIELPNKVSLVGPSGATWDVTLAKTNNVALAGDGWKDFVKAYSLKPTYILIIKYKRSVGFEVLIFDPVSLCEKEDGYFVKKNDKPTINSNNHDDKEKKRSSAEAFGTCTVLIEDNENGDESEFATSKRVKKDNEDPTCMGETNNKQTSRKLLYGRVKRGSKWGRGKIRRGRISVSHLKAKSVEMSKRNEASEEQPIVENCEGDLELGCSHEASEIKDMLGKKQNGNEGISPESGEVNLEAVESPKPNETEAENETNGSEPVKELNSPENGESILEIVHRLRRYETRGKKLMEPEATEEQHGVVHSSMSLEVIGNHACKSSGARTRPRKQSAPTKKSLVYENVLSGDKSNTNEAAKEQNGVDGEAIAPEIEMVCYDKTIKTRGQRRRQIAPTTSPSEVEAMQLVT